MNLVPSQGGPGQVWPRSWIQGTWAGGQPSRPLNRHGPSPGQEESGLAAPAGGGRLIFSDKKRKVRRSRRATARGSAARFLLLWGLGRPFPPSWKVTGCSRPQPPSTELWARPSSSPSFPLTPRQLVSCEERPPLGRGFQVEARPDCVQCLGRGSVACGAGRGPATPPLPAPEPPCTLPRGRVPRSLLCHTDRKRQL